MSKIYELHMVTFGENSYAHKIATLMDPQRKYFHDRILSRNEIINPTSKADNLKSLFPHGDLMVCIIDDREDVWNYARNLICVQPYAYFKHTGDINDPSLLSKQHRSSVGNNNNNNGNSSSRIKRKPPINSDTDQQKLKSSSSGGGEDETTSSTIANDVESMATSTSPPNQISNNMNSEDSSSSLSSPSPYVIEPYDPDDYLVHLERILRTVHDEYYRIYDERVRSRQSLSSSLHMVQDHHNNKEQLKQHHHCAQPTDDRHDEQYQHQHKRVKRDVNESDLPDVKKILPMIKSRVLDGCVITFSGVIPTGYDLKKQRCYLMARSLGAKVNEELVLANEDSTATTTTTTAAVNEDEMDAADDENESAVGASEVEAFEALLAEKLTPKCTKMHQNDLEERKQINQQQNQERNSEQKNQQRRRRRRRQKQRRSKYEYTYDDENDESSSECSSGGDYTTRSTSSSSSSSLLSTNTTTSGSSSSSSSNDECSNDDADADSENVHSDVNVDVSPRRDQNTDATASVIVIDAVAKMNQSDTSQTISTNTQFKKVMTMTTKKNKTKKKTRTRRHTTHLVAAKYGTVKVYEAMKSKVPIKVVTPEWLINCNYKWSRCDENEYKLTKDYEYRNCIFHHDYNFH